MINSEKYSDILKCGVVQIMEENLPNGDGILQCDLAPCHSSRKVKKVIEELEINMLHWPVKCQDLNPVENIQGITESRLGKMDCSTNEWLISDLIKVWIYDGGIRNMCEKTCYVDATLHKLYCN